ncbi:MAG: hypothetical protein GF313_09585 [Caldithrix sp.]|nr:hypothetical protein [Caldithrix sp.]
MDKNNNFKVCPSCGFEWKYRKEFVEDDNLCIVGYQANFKHLTAGLLLFNHSCKSTLALQVSVLRDLYEGPVFREKATGTDECPGYCLNKHNLDACQAECECAFVREIIQRLKN